MRWNKTVEESNRFVEWIVEFRARLPQAHAHSLSRIRIGPFEWRRVTVEEDLESGVHSAKWR